MERVRIFPTRMVDVKFFKTNKYIFLYYEISSLIRGRGLKTYWTTRVGEKLCFSTKGVDHDDTAINKKMCAVRPP